MSELSREDINHLAKLARISLTDGDRKILARDLPKIVEFVDQISKAKVDTAPTSATTRLADLRPDEPQSRNLSTDDLKKLAPGFDDGFVQVPSVFES